MSHRTQTGAGVAGTTPGGDADRCASPAPTFSWSYPGRGCDACRGAVPAPTTPAGAARHNRPRRCVHPAGIVQEAAA